MKKFLKGFAIQATINAILQIIRIVVGILIVKFSPVEKVAGIYNPDSGWQLICWLVIFAYNLISLIVPIILLIIRNKKIDSNVLAGYCVVSVIITIYLVYISGFFQSLVPVKYENTNNLSNKLISLTKNEMIISPTINEITNNLNNNLLSPNINGTK